MVIKKILLFSLFLILASCASPSKNNRGVASLDEAKPSEKGSCGQIMSGFIKGRKIVNKNGLGDLFPGESKYSPAELSQVQKVSDKIGDELISKIPNNRIERDFQTFAYSKLIQDNLKEIDPVEYNTWFRLNVDSVVAKFDEDKNISDTFDETLDAFKEWRAGNGFSFKNMLKLKNGTNESKQVLKNLEESAMADYNAIIGAKINSYDTYQDFLDDSVAAISNFNLFEENFQGPGYLRWLSENHFLSEDVFLKLKNGADDDQTLGDLLSNNYLEYIPFSKKPEMPKKSIKEKIRDYAIDMFTKKKKDIDECGGDPDCALKETKSIFQRMLGADDLKKNFSCLRQFPQARNAMYADFVVTWSMLGYLYKNNEENFERFPWEVVTSGLIFTPIMSEVNCQASFQTRNAFGGLVNIAKQPSKTRAFLKNWRRVTGVSIASGVGLVGLGLGFNQLYAALGHPVENSESLQEQMRMLPFMFMWSGVLGGLKNIAVLNPLKHKVIPKLAAMIQSKTGIASGSAISLTAMNVALVSANEYYSSVSFNEIWRYYIIPKYLEMIGYDSPGDQDLKGDTRVEAFDANTDIFITEYEEGVKTSVKVEKSYDDEGKEYIKVEDINIEIPDYFLEESVSEVPKAE
ncbi:hypothetical protein [Halobacteriovorax sp.]|uniref:hypothetical protein n=1 Tax=Halobacteriovorax sp. TaxID=2020862 RepID=UPI003568BB2E